MKYVKWTPRLISRLAVLFEDGATFTEIGECLGCSRMAAMTAAHRLGMRRRTTDTNGGQNRKELLARLPSLYLPIPVSPARRW
jgi:hypothetical protein